LKITAVFAGKSAPAGENPIVPASLENSWPDGDYRAVDAGLSGYRG
jgi:hypothetical protein